MKTILYLSLTISILFSACEDDDSKYYKLPPSTGGTMELQGGEGQALAKNSVYVDFSTGTQNSIERISWHLAFHSDSQFGVKLNGSIGSRATEAANDITINTVISQEGYDNYLLLLAPQMGTGDFDTADKINSDTDLSGTVIKKDKTYIYCSGDDDKIVYKILVSEKNSSTYTISYARWDSPTAQTLDIVKDNIYNFVGISFTENKKVNIQPAKDEWDIVWGRNTYISAMAEGVPFMLSDLVFLNTKTGVQAQEVLVSETVTYNNYVAGNVEHTLFSSDIDAIGSKWRNGGGPSTSPSVETDRFYIIKDSQGNIYKLGFVSMNEGADGGRRGYPEIKYNLLIEAE